MWVSIILKYIYEEKCTSQHRQCFIETASFWSINCISAIIIPIKCSYWLWDSLWLCSLKVIHAVVQHFIDKPCLWSPVTYNFIVTELASAWSKRLLPKGYVGKPCRFWLHYGGVIMGAMASRITSLAIVYSTIHSDADQRRHQSCA